MPRRATELTVPRLLNPRRSQLVYESRAALVNPVELGDTKWLRVRRDMMESFEGFSSSNKRNDGEYVLTRSGRRGADQEYLLKLTREVISIAAGKGVIVETFADLYSRVWSSIAEHFSIESSALSVFDINLTWTVETHGNPYVNSIIPALSSSSLDFLQDLFVSEFDQKITFQRQADLAKPTYVLAIGSPHRYQDIADFTKMDESNEIRLKLGIGLTNDCLGGMNRMSLGEVAAAHWEHVASALETDLYERLIEPVLASLEAGKPTTGTGTGKKPSKSRHSSSKSKKKLSKGSKASSTGRRRKKGTGRS